MGWGGVIMRLREITLTHVLSITFLIFIADSGDGERRGTLGTGMVRKALYVEETFTLAANLLVLSAAVQLSITHGTLEVKRENICTILLGQGGEGVERGHLCSSRSQS